MQLWLSTGTLLASLTAPIDAGIARGDFAGAVVRVERGGALLTEFARGHRHRYALDAASGAVRAVPTPLPMTLDAVFDLASLTKLVTTLGVLLPGPTAAPRVPAVPLPLDAPLASLLPALAQAGGDQALLTPRQLLQHRSGLAPWLPLYIRAPSRDALAASIAAEPRLGAANAARVYSDLNFILLGLALEAQAQRGLDLVLAERLFTPLGLRHTGFAPRPAHAPLVSTSHGTPFERRMLDDPRLGVHWRGPERAADFAGWRRRTLYGEVNDGNAYHAADQRAGHAGLFSTAAELSQLLQLFVPGGSARAGQLGLTPARLAEVFRDGPRGHHLGWHPASQLPMPPGGAPLPPQALAHLGFTGTFAYLDPDSGLSVVVLTNRQHRADAVGNYADLRPLFVALVTAVLEGIDPAHAP